MTIGRLRATGRRLAFGGLPLAALVFAAGCVPDPFVRGNERDPYFDRDPRNNRPVAAAPSGERLTDHRLPPYVPSTPASLASRTTSQPDWAKDPRLAGHATTAAAAGGDGGPPNVTLQSPTATYDANSPRAGSGYLPPPGAVTPVAAVGDALAPLKQAIEARGPAWSKSEMVGKNQWLYAVSIPNKQNPALSRNYEATAASEAAAVRAVLEQIDRDLP